MWHCLDEDSLRNLLQTRCPGTHHHCSSEGWGARASPGAPGETCCHAGSPTQKALHLVQAQQSLFQIPQHFVIKTPAFPVCPGPSRLRDWSCLHSSTPPDLPVHRYSSLGGITQDNLVSSLPGPLLSVTHCPLMLGFWGEVMVASRRRVLSVRAPGVRGW